jgi:hypothetical protein
MKSILIFGKLTNSTVTRNTCDLTIWFRLLRREWLIIDQTMLNNLQYMSTIQALPSNKQILKKNKDNLHNQTVSDTLFVYII